ncbi:hypothetical protein [Breoghania corrubedonensis]|uniref:hypothetical protein n=1 Tax=Breoghania corrubedonensis TaxID=665038 RepID=UPI0011B23CD0|nr:hypothetical protein [Breoghania corrubedonensis]
MANSQFEFPYDGFCTPSSAKPPNGSADQAKALSIAVEARKPSSREGERREHEARRSGQPPLDAQDEPFGERYVSVRNVALRYDCSVPTIWRWVGQRTGFPSPVKAELRLHAMASL